MNILQQCEAPGANITKISEETHLSLPRAKQLVEKMVANGTLRISNSNNKPKQRYIITSNGQQLKNSLKTAMNVLERRERKDIRKRSKKEKTSLPINIW